MMRLRQKKADGFFAALVLASTEVAGWRTWYGGEGTPFDDEAIPKADTLVVALEFTEKAAGFPPEG